MGVLLDLAYRRRWLMLTGVMQALVAVWVPVRAVRTALLLTGLALIVAGLVVSTLGALRDRPQQPD